MQELSYQFKEGIYEVQNDAPQFDVFHVQQIHSAIVIQAQENLKQDLIEADGIIIPKDYPHPVAIKTADCLPILLIGSHGCALLHAGWRGLAGKIISDQKVQAIAPHSCLIGPYIHAEDYEVGAEFTKNFPQSNAFQENTGRICFDLLLEAVKQIKDCYNIDPITSLAKNTFREKSLNSWRRDKAEKRNWNIFKNI